MKLSNKLQTLLTDMLDKLQRRQWHVRCGWCRWTVRNLEHKRFATARGKMHHNNSHQFSRAHYVPNRIVVWSTRA